MMDSWGWTHPPVMWVLHRHCARGWAREKGGGWQGAHLAWADPPWPDSGHHCAPSFHVDPSVDPEGSRGPCLVSVTPRPLLVCLPPFPRGRLGLPKSPWGQAGPTPTCLLLPFCCAGHGATILA